MVRTVKMETLCGFFCAELSKYILARYQYNHIFSQDFLLKDIYNSDRHLIVYKDSNYTQIGLYIACTIDSKKKDLGCRLMVGDMFDSLVYAVGYCMFLIFSNSLDSLTFHVLDDNTEMLNLCLKARMTEVESDFPGRRKFQTSISSLIFTFRKFYHRFSREIKDQYFSELVVKSNTIFVNQSFTKLSNVYSFDNVYYFKTFDKTVIASQRINPLIYNYNADDLAPILVETLSSSEASYGLANDFLSYSPTDLFIFPTFACNLRCRYCYSEATPLKNKELCFDVAKVGVDFIINNAIKLKRKSVSLTFHGGGEPTINIKLINQIVDYADSVANEKNLKLFISVSTNATNYNEQVKHLFSKCNSLQFSFDGTKFVQDLHRPFASENSSYKTVVDNIKHIHSDFPHLRFSIRSTVSEQSIEHMLNSVKLFAELGAKTVIFEPLLEVGRALENKSKINAPDIVRFSEQFIKCKQLGRQLGIIVKSSGDAIFRSGTFCGASRENCVLTPDGKISMCVEVSDPDDALSKYLIIGYIKDNKVVLNEDKISYIQRYGRRINPECRICIAQKSCRGNCLTRTMRANETADEFLINDLCVMQTRLFIDNMKTLHEGIEKQ